MTTFNNQVHINEQDQLRTMKLKSDRFFFVETVGWYFYCREGNKGPFTTRKVAEHTLSHYLSVQPKY